MIASSTGAAAAHSLVSSWNGERPWIGRCSYMNLLEATITGSQDGVVEARILDYDFRTRRPTEWSK